MPARHNLATSLPRDEDWSELVDRTAGHRLGAGGFPLAPQRSTHAELRSETGCVLLIVASQTL